MHEAALLHGAVETTVAAMRKAGATRVTRVSLVIGASSHVTEESARLHFALAAALTPVATATLDIEWLPATYQCFTCLRSFESLLPEDQVACPDCGGAALEANHLDVCYPVSIEVGYDDPSLIEAEADTPLAGPSGAPQCV